MSYIAFGIADRYTTDANALDALSRSLQSEVVGMKAELEVKISKMLLQQAELHLVQSKAEQKVAEQKVVNVAQHASLALLMHHHLPDPRRSDGSLARQHPDRGGGDRSFREQYAAIYYRYSC